MEQLKCSRQLCYFAAVSALQAGSTAAVASLLWGGRQVQAIAGILIMARNTITDALPAIPQPRVHAAAQEPRLRWRDYLAMAVTVVTALPLMRVAITVNDSCTSNTTVGPNTSENQAAFVEVKKKRRELAQQSRRVAANNNRIEILNFNARLDTAQKQCANNYLPRFHSLYRLNSALHLPAQLLCLLAAPHVGIPVCTAVSATLLGSFLFQHGLIYWHGIRPIAGLSRLELTPPADDNSPRPQPVSAPAKSTGANSSAALQNIFRPRASQALTGRGSDPIPKWACRKDQLESRLNEIKTRLSNDKSARNFVVSYHFTRESNGSLISTYKLHFVDPDTRKVMIFDIKKKDVISCKQDGTRQSDEVFFIQQESGDGMAKGTTIEKMLKSRPYKPQPGERVSLSRQYLITPQIGVLHYRLLLNGVDTGTQKITAGVKQIVERATTRVP